jgi:hypothetical protein
MMRRSPCCALLLLLPLLLLVVAVVASSSSSSLQKKKEQKTWTLYHAWKGHDFSKRGSISLTLIDDDDDNNNNKNSVVVPTLSIDNVATAQDLPMEDLYQLKLVENVVIMDNDKQEELFTLVSVPACQVHRANFRCVCCCCLH